MDLRAPVTMSDTDRRCNIAARDTCGKSRWHSVQ
jgi:hypothetical protein